MTEQQTRPPQTPDLRQLGALEDWCADEECHHGKGLSCMDCQHEAEADDATWD